MPLLLMNPTMVEGDKTNGVPGPLDNSKLGQGRFELVLEIIENLFSLITWLRKAARKLL